MNPNSASPAMLRSVQSSLDPNSADYFPQSQQYLRMASGQGGAGVSGLQPSPYSTRGMATNAGGMYPPPHSIPQYNSNLRNGTVYYPNNNNLSSNVMNNLGMYGANANQLQMGRMQANSRQGGTSAPLQGVVYSQHAVNHNNSPAQNRQALPQLQQPTLYGPFSSNLNSNLSNAPPINSTTGGSAVDVLYGGAVPLPRSQRQVSDPFQPAPVVADEWLGSDTPKASPEVATDQFQNIFATLLADGEVKKAQIRTDSEQPIVAALDRDRLTLEDDGDEDLTQLIAQINIKKPQESVSRNDEGQISPDPKAGAIGVGRTASKYTSSIIMPEESPPIQITATAFLPTPDASPPLAPSNVKGGLEPSPMKSTSPMLPQSAVPITKPNSEANSVSNGSIAAPKAVDQSPSPTSEGEAEPEESTGNVFVKPNLASLVAGNVKPAGPPKGSMAEKLLMSGNVNKSPASQLPPAFGSPASNNKAPSAIATSPTSKGLPTNKAGVEKFLRDGDAPETLRHIKILAFSSHYPNEIKALFELWAGNGIPPPDDAFGAYYWYVRKKLGRDLCMKHNGPGKAPGVGYGGCDYAVRGQGQCRYFHQCLFCTKEDHGWFDENKCGRYKTYQKELAKLRITEEQVYELVAAYGK